MPVSLTENSSIKIKLNCHFAREGRSQILKIMVANFLGQLVHYSKADIMWILNPLIPKSAIWHIMPQLCQYLTDFYEFLTPRCSCENLLIKRIKT